MSQRHAKQKIKRPMSQPAIPPTISANSEESQPPPNNVPPYSPPSTSHARRELHDSDSERTMSASPTNDPTSPIPNPDPSNKMTMLIPKSDGTFVPNSAHRQVFPCMTKIFTEAIKSFKAAPIRLKEIWFDEFRKLYTWKPEDEPAIRKIFEKIGTSRLPDRLREVRRKLENDEPHPTWMSNAVLAQYQYIWDKDEFKNTAARNKRNRNSDCGGMGPSLHTAGSIPMSEHRRRWKEKYGEEPSHAALFQATHKSKKTDQFVCKKAQHVMDTATQLQETQPEIGAETAWYEATGGIKKRGRVSGFGSVTQHYFPEAMKEKKSNSGQSSSHSYCEEQIKELKEENKRILEQNQIMMERFRRMESRFALFDENPHLFQFTNSNLDGASSQGASGVGLDDCGLDSATQPPP